MRPNANQRIGLYGGTFSPVHVGHIMSALSFKKRFCLDKLIIMPAAIPPHKEIKDGVAKEHRLNMCRLAFEGQSGVTVSELEMNRTGKSYTFDTLTELRSQYENAELFMLCGTDMILTFDEWYRYEDIFRLVTLVCVRRENEAEVGEILSQKIASYNKEHSASISQLSLDPSVLTAYPEFTERVNTFGSHLGDGISSTVVRRAIAEGGDVSGLVPSRVLEYVREHGLYTRDER